MELVRQSGTHHIQGTKSDPKVADGMLREDVAGELCRGTSNARRQGSCSAHSEHSEQFRQRQPSDDEGALLFKDILG